MEKEIVDAAKPKPNAQKLFKRGRSFRDIQSEISKINPEVLKAVIASGSSATTTSKPPTTTISSFSIPSTPREHHGFLPPLLPLYIATHRPTTTTITASTRGCDCGDSCASLTIFYSGTVAVFEVPRCKADCILELAGEEESIKNVKLVEDGESLKDVQSTSAMNFRITPNEYDRNLNESWKSDLPLAPNRSLKRFLEKRKERLIMGSPYANGNQE